MNFASSGGADNLIIGGGVIGLSIAWYLAKKGATVTVLESGQVGGQASGAAAGMLAPLAEASAQNDFVRLGIESLYRYPEFASELHSETFIDIELIGPGMIRVAFDADEAETLQHTLAWQQSLSLRLALLNSKEIHWLEPAIPRTITCGILSTDEKQVEPRRMMRALTLACSKLGVKIVEGAPVVSIHRVRNAVYGVQTPTERYNCGNLIIAAGAWSANLGAMLQFPLPVVPIRGQILSLITHQPPIRHTLYTHDGYMVPKADGRLVVGATEDEAGFDTSSTVEATLSLLSIACKLVPEAKSAKVHQLWAGLRPATPNRLPLMGAIPGLQNAFAAVGHFRNGILLTPITGALMAENITSGRTPELLKPFALPEDQAV